MLFTTIINVFAYRVFYNNIFQFTTILKMKKQFLHLTIKSTNKGLNIYNAFLVSIFKKLSIFYKQIQMPVIRKRITIVKSPHVNKKAREQFELKIFKKTLLIQTELKIEILKFILVNKPKFIKLIIRKII